jgi:DNA polymerase-3 subunit beta
VLDLIHGIKRGCLYASIKDTNPPYRSSAYFELSDTGLNIVSTDRRQLAVCYVNASDRRTGAFLLSMKGIAVLKKVLNVLNGNTLVNIRHDDSQAYFIADGVEISVKKSEGYFPSYQRILPSSVSSSIDVNKAEFISAVERINLFTKDPNRAVYFKQSKGRSLILHSRDQEFSEVTECVDSFFEGDEIASAFSAKCFLDAAMAIDGDVISLLFASSDAGHVMLKPKNSDCFKCLIASIELSPDDQTLQNL